MDKFAYFMLGAVLYAIIDLLFTIIKNVYKQFKNKESIK